MATLIGNSGFEYTSSLDKDRKGYIHYLNVSVKNIKTKKVLFTMKGGHYSTGRGTRSTRHNLRPTKKFLGFDNRWYYIQAFESVDWGQIQSSGAVLKSDRTMLTQVDFYPIYTPKPTVTILNKPEPQIESIAPSIKTISPEPKLKIKVTEHKTITLKPIKEESLWYENLIIQINQIIDRIEKMIRSILNL